MSFCTLTKKKKLILLCIIKYIKIELKEIGRSRKKDTKFN